jgi:hypothetical protein
MPAIRILQPLLDAGDDAAQLLPLLRLLATRPMDERAPALGLTGKYLEHPRAEVRAAAVAALAGARGLPAWRWLVAALFDEDASVRLAAAGAVHECAQHDPPRFAHVLFHPEPLVRAAGCRPLPDKSRLRDFLAANVFHCGFPDDDRRRLEKIIYERAVELKAVSPAEELPDTVSLDMISHAVRGVLASGQEHLLPKLTKWIDGSGAVPQLREDLLVMVVTQAGWKAARDMARSRLPPKETGNLKLRRLAHTFAWGVELGYWLLGQRYHINMVLREGQFGYTRLRGNTIHITPLPILRGERNGIDAVRGLIAHEYGHHLYHKGPENEPVWEEAEKEGLGRLLNLVADEHLERNLRHRSSRLGDLLKTLNAFAFQHQAREFGVGFLINILGDRTFEVLSSMPLGAAWKEGCVAITSGRLLREMDRLGFSFSRFFRALRLGLGDRSGDPRVAEALRLFKGRFRHSTMPQLLEIARKLREIFGAETSLLDGGYAPDDAFSTDEAEGLASGSGIQGDALQREVDKLLDEPKDPGAGSAGAGGPRGLNVGANEHFNEITKVQVIPHNPAEHAKYARQVTRPAQQLRRYFENLGFGLRAHPRRLQGRSVERGRLRRMVLTGDPRVLISRQIKRYTDLFMGVIIDCSGSMAGASMEKARLFGTLLAEAVRGQPGIDLRLFGFTDRVIYDAGNARRCAVHGLVANGGNNDAAGLWHTYLEARRSKRQAKLLVMISDGAPTECTVAALRGLVQRLTRRKCCCAQVAVQPLTEICFPHYVLLQDNRLDACVREFGKVIMKLVGAALGKQ